MQNMRRHRSTDAAKLTARIWKDANRARLQIYDQTKRLKRLGQMAGKKIDPVMWKNLLAAHGYQCFYCLFCPKKLVMEHMTPLSRGGSHTLDNIVPACSPCNSKKFTKTAEDFMETR